MKMSMVWIGVALALLTSSPAAAGTLGAGGPLGDVDLVNETVEVGRHTLKVTSHSVMRDSHGQRISLADLDRLKGEAGVRMLDARGGYILQELQMLGAQEDDPEIDSPLAKKSTTGSANSKGRWPAKGKAR